MAGVRPVTFDVARPDGAAAIALVHLVSLNNSRPISIRRISEVPAPIS